MLLNIDCDNEVILTDLICQSRFSTIFAGNFRGKPVAVKRVDFERLHESIKYTSTKDALEKLHFPDCHENVLNLIHISYKDGMWYYFISFRMKNWNISFSCFRNFVTEKCDGSLNDYFEKLPRNDVKVLPCTISCVVQIAHGLSWLHAKDRVHGDIKPENILILKNDGEWKYKIGLPGVTEFVEGETERFLNNKSQPMMSPEVMKGEKPTKESDCFSSGILFFFIATNGKHPCGLRPDQFTKIEMMERNFNFACKLKTCLFSFHFFWFAFVFSVGFMWPEESKNQTHHRKSDKTWEIWEDGNVNCELWAFNMKIHEANLRSFWCSCLAWIQKDSTWIVDKRLFHECQHVISWI